VTTTDAADTLLHNIAAFGRVLRNSGLEVGPRRLQTALRAVDVLGLRARDDVYWALFCSLVSRREETAAFDLAFTTFWERRIPSPDVEEGPSEMRESDERDEEAPPGAAGEQTVTALQAAASTDADAPDADDPGRGLSWSPQEHLRHLDFSAYRAAELREARRFIQALGGAAPRRRSRRFRPARAGREMDRRRTLRSAMRTEGHPVERCWREQRLVHRKLVFLIDVSGSMEPYARPLVLFAQVVRQAARKVEVFTFGTRLTRITPELAGRDTGRALRRVAQAIPDWAGGTRIGDAMKAFNDTAGRRGMTRGAVVVVFSDGCERGDPELLGAEMARVHRAAHTVVWVNPLAGDVRYEPRTQGMVAALPHIDVLLAGHNLVALETLAAVLEAVPQRRSRRAVR
jgi:uncharacterized protein with von Willebrand factor type A (vWA) domain